MPELKTRGGRREGAGKKPLPLDRKKVRVVAFVTPQTAEWLEQQGGAKFAAKVLEEARRS